MEQSWALRPSSSRETQPGTGSANLVLQCICSWFCIIRKSLREKNKGKKKEKIAKRETNREEKKEWDEKPWSVEWIWRRQSTERGEGELRGGWSSMQSMQKCLDAEMPGCKAPKISPGQSGRNLPSRAMPPHFAPLPFPTASTTELHSVSESPFSQV